MGRETLGVDLYQLTTAAAHTAAGRLGQRVSMAFFFREMPRQRSYVVFCGLRACLQHAAKLGLTAGELDAVLAAPPLGQLLAAVPQLVTALGELDGFDGDIDALPEGTLAFAAPGVRPDGSPFLVAGAQLQLYTPLIQVTTDMLRAKLLETPWLGRINAMSMVASKAARVVTAAAGKPVVEFGARRTHPDAAVDAAYAAYLAGCTGTSNLEAFVRHGVPLLGTMDHFAVQALERAGQSDEQSELQAFLDLVAVSQERPILLVDTYDTMRGIRNAVRAAGPRLGGVRLDSNVTVETVRRARQLLDELGARDARILLSDRLDEHRITELRDQADGFGVGEAITCSPDSAAGVGAVAKLVVNGYGELTMKLCHGSAKATLPGMLQVWRYPDRDLIGFADEAGPSGAVPLLQPVWRGRSPLPAPSLRESREHVQRQLAGLPGDLLLLDRVVPRVMVATASLVEVVERLAMRAELGETECSGQPATACPR